jgi:CRISPR/Cas system-associated exonuclease Cas4 (RecB family)
VSQFANIIFKRTPYNLENFAKLIDASYSDANNVDEFKTKTGFSASTLGYLHGLCPRKWVMLFQGAQVVENHASQSVDNMRTGTDAHARIQDNFISSGLEIKVEHEFWNEDPPFHGFVDLIVRNFDGFDIVIEIKTTRTEAFASRRAKNKGPDYQELQLLIYLYILNIRHGILLYEDKNDHKKLLIPVEMTDENKARMDKVFEWLRLVYKTYKDGKLPERPFRKNSKACASCPLLGWCGEQPAGDVKIPALEIT